MSVAYELWQKTERLGTTTMVGIRYGWMVWRVGPITGGETWFQTEEEARVWIAERLAEENFA